MIVYKLKMSIGMLQNYSSVPKCVTHDVCFSFAAAWRALRDSFPGKPIKGCVFPLEPGGVASCTAVRLIGDVPAVRRDV